MNNSVQRNVSVAENAFNRVPSENAQVIRRNSRSFSFASLLLPADVREDVQKLYAWCRWCDDAVDSAASVQDAAAQLALLREDVQRIYRGEQPLHGASIWLAELVAKHRIESELPLGLLDGMEIDLRLGQIQTEQELLRYCFHAAGVVGLMMCRIFGVTDPRALRHAKSLGIAMQLTNIARDVREDWERGRCYLPATWFCPDAADRLPTNAQVRSTLQRILELADEHYAIGNAGIRYLPGNVRTAIRIASAVYREIGRQIIRKQLRVMDGRVIVPKLRFVIAASLAWIGGVVRDAQESVHPLCSDKNGTSFNSEELTMNDAKYLVYLGLSLTAFMGSALFVLVMINPKEATYSTLPLIYAVVCFAIGIATNLLAKKAEKPVPVLVETKRPTQTR